ncbi:MULTISPECIES: NAD(P)H-dependent flavin oxidoreductase [unclassified Sphingobium]|uniref:NAD(P)H-dependent flavin oxidoreductase n=1 Tax=unclassified Sphingobium TaxID=2611147 RepID=UPI000D158998|nr:MULTISPECIES: nitronate monooxygenase [unclassified Sphingobium]MBG6120123.1 enoyl-[acyl-carrier protein] reductase II [Sphingobium sp. JAI105]PSO12834.1 nitronate monooxygenase [Sphingobium sp. AEW4]TWD05676.1 enoyl-[acyl-carrier protein] reductase II [Sphingobium sp. AEW010]TWD23229.1 enoyl-[acyl-carrier protein] reductase II [Sphingobium sp. AEW013]TWD25089.1 enoyl-[acyl-carrier protein] reductase II [Sphingobium sp. AEW001]
MKTRITDLFGVKYPILNAGMGRVAFPEMVVAVTNAGGLGNLGAGSNDPKETRKHIEEIRKLTDRPFALNAPLALPNAMDNVKLALDMEVPVINYSMGKGDWIVERARKYGGKVMASVNSVKLAQSAQKHGADAVIVAGHEAAGHAGQITTFILLQRLKEVIDIPLIAAGGVANGRGLAAALALGADGVSMGTRMWTTQEGVMHQNFKDWAVKADVDGTLFSTKFDGYWLRVGNTPGPAGIASGAEKLNIFKVFLNSFEIAKEMGQPYSKVFMDVIKRGPRGTYDMIRMARMLTMVEASRKSGDFSKGQVGAGQSVGLVHDLPTIKEVIERIVNEAYDVLDELGGKIERP